MIQAPGSWQRIAERHPTARLSRVFGQFNTIELAFNPPLANGYPHRRAVDQGRGIVFLLARLLPHSEMDDVARGFLHVERSDTNQPDNPFDTVPVLWYAPISTYYSSTHRECHFEDIEYTFDPPLRLWDNDWVTTHDGMVVPQRIGFHIDLRIWSVQRADGTPNWDAEIWVGTV